MAKRKGSKPDMTEGGEVTNHSGQDPDPERHDFARVLGALALLLASLTPLVRAVTDIATASIALVVVIPMWVLAWRVHR